MKNGDAPSRSTQRARFWKNEAAFNADAYGKDAVERMRKGQGPRRVNSKKQDAMPDSGGWETMEVSHEPIPYRDGGKELVARWPQDHAAIDPYRHPGY